MVVVDSSIWIEAARRNGDLGCKVGLEGLLDASEALLCSTVRLEVLGGARAQDRKRMAAYLDCIPYQKTQDSDWAHCIECAWRARDQGLTVPWNDIVIASLAVRLKCRLYARDTHLEKMQPVLGYILYTPGYGGSYNPGP